MALSKRFILTTLSIIYLTTLTLLAAYALHKTRAHHLPIPNILGAFTLALPPIAGLLLQVLTSPNTDDRLSKYAPRLGSRASMSQFSLTLLFVYEAVLAALAGTYIAPVENLGCGLETRWRSLFVAKEGDVIGRIQDAFSCCGLKSSRDMAYPFPSHSRGANACEVLYDHTKSCFESWRAEERGVAGIILGVSVGVALWKLVVLWVSGRQGTWFEERGGEARRTLEYPAVRGGEAPYRDVEEDAEEALTAVTGRVQPSRLRDNEVWAEENSR